MIAALALVLALRGPGPEREAPEPSPSLPETEVAEPAQTELVLIHVAPDRPDIRARLQAELGLLGFVSERLELSDASKVLGPDLLDRLAPAGADAAIEISLTPERINLWVADANTGTTVHRRLDLIANPELADPRTLAISAVELLRASRLELESEPVPEPVPVPVVDDELPPDDDDDELEPPPRPLRGAISLVPMVTASPGGFGPAAHVEIAGRWAPRKRFALRFSMMVPTVPNRLVRSQGNARLLYGMLFVEPQLRLPGGAAWFHPELGVGVGLAVVSVEGSAEAPYRSNAKVVAGFAAHGHVGFGFAATPRVWIRLDGYLGVVTPQPLVTFGNEEVARWGLPWGTGSLGIELWF
ncbi:hypothetical protein ACNOYE_18255 [Nannocystaceae bacterium ST9]